MFNREIYQWSMNSNLIVIDDNLHCSLFSSSDVKQSQIGRTIRHNSKRILNREAFQDSNGKYSNEFFVRWNDQFQKQFFLLNKIIFFPNFLYICLKTEDIALSVLTVYLIFQFVKTFS